MAASRRPSTNRVAAPSLTDLFRRLEAATSRLEDIATSVAPFDQVGGSPASGLAITSPPEEGASPQPGALVVAAQAPSAPPKPELPAEVEGFDKLVTGELAAFIKLSDALDPLLGKQAS
jgi:adenylyl cyclase-associated protein